MSWEPRYSPERNCSSLSMAESLHSSDQIIQGDVEIVGQGDQAIKIRPVFPRLIIVNCPAGHVQGIPDRLL